MKNNYLILYTVKLKNATDKTFVNRNIKASSFGDAEKKFLKKHNNSELVIEIVQITIFS